MRVVINRKMITHPNLQSQIIIINQSPDVVGSYNAIMNTIFRYDTVLCTEFICYSAQKMFVPVDTIMLGQQESLFLQQASFLTGGVYYRPSTMRSLLYFMFAHCLPTTSQRKIFKSPLMVTLLN